MTEEEQTIHNARIAWNAMSFDERKVVVRWLALAKHNRDVFCKIVQDDGNCPRERKHE